MYLPYIKKYFQQHQWSFLFSPSVENFKYVSTLRKKIFSAATVKFFSLLSSKYSCSFVLANMKVWRWSIVKVLFSYTPKHLDLFFFAKFSLKEIKDHSLRKKIRITVCNRNSRQVDAYRKKRQYKSKFHNKNV